MSKKTTVFLGVAAVLASIFFSFSTAIATQSFGTPYVTVRFPDNYIVLKGADAIQSVDEDGFFQALFPNAEYDFVAIDPNRRLSWFSFGIDFESTDSVLYFTQAEITELLTALNETIPQNIVSGVKTGFTNSLKNGLVLTQEVSFSDESEMLLYIIPFMKKAGTPHACVLGCLSISSFDSAVLAYVEETIQKDTFYPGTLAKLVSDVEKATQSILQEDTNSSKSDNKIDSLVVFLVLFWMAIISIIVSLAVYIKKHPSHPVVIRRIFIFTLWLTLYSIVTVILKEFFVLGFIPTLVIGLIFYFLGKRHYDWIAERAGEEKNNDSNEYYI